MNIQMTNVLIDGLFARKVIKTIKAGDCNEKSEVILEQVKDHMKSIQTGQTEITNYETSTVNSLKHLSDYGNAITLVQSSPTLYKNEDCLDEISKNILSEVETALTSKTISPTILPTTLQWYQEMRKLSIQQGSRFNIQPSPENAWGIVTKY